MFIGVEEDAKIAKSAFEFAYKFIMRRSNKNTKDTELKGTQERV